MDAINSCTTLDALTEIEISLLGRNGEINQAMQSLKTAPPDKRKALGQTLNMRKKMYTEAIIAKRTQLIQSAKLQRNKTVRLPGVMPRIGRLHPTTETIRFLNAFFRYYGYSVYDGPEIETDLYCYDKLNLPQDHPARELTDTLYIKGPEYLLRCHTSSVETRCMTNHAPPIRIVVPGKVYRNENANATNNAMFYQYEGLYVDTHVTLGDLKGMLELFAQHLYGKDVHTRFRCKYYPQVEPGGGLDIQCTFCKGAGCVTCKYRGWIEALGCGMVHPEVLRRCQIDPTHYSGFAFGLGLDRLVMLRYGISDIRSLYSGALAWL